MPDCIGASDKELRLQLDELKDFEEPARVALDAARAELAHVQARIDEIEEELNTRRRRRHGCL